MTTVATMVPTSTGQFSVRRTSSDRSIARQPKQLEKERFLAHRVDFTVFALPQAGLSRRMLRHPVGGFDLALLRDWGGPASVVVAAVFVGVMAGRNAIEHGADCLNA